MICDFAALPEHEKDAHRLVKAGLRLGAQSVGRSLLAAAWYDLPPISDMAAAELARREALDT